MGPDNWCLLTVYVPSANLLQEVLEMARPETGMGYMGEIKHALQPMGIQLERLAVLEQVKESQL